MFHLSPSHHFFLETTGSGFPFFRLSGLRFESALELFALILPLLHLLDLLGHFELPLFIGVVFIIFLPQYLVEPQQFLVEQSQFVFMICDEVLVVAEFHYGDLVLLALLPQVINVPVAVFQQLTTFNDLVFKTRTLVLEANYHLSDLSVDHGLALAVHHGAKIFELLGLTAF